MAVVFPELSFGNRWREHHLDPSRVDRLFASWLAVTDWQLISKPDTMSE